MKRIIAVFLLMTLILTTACADKAERWAYNHEPETEILSLNEGNGTALYKGVKYKYEKTPDRINLKDDKGETLSLRYVAEGDGMILYEASTYIRDGEGSQGPDSIVGDWKQENGWIFRFTAEGGFSEEDMFYGHYSLNEEQHSIKLMYDDPLEDAILYYTLDGDRLTIEYPWPLVRVQK
ncbi:MAG: hypothetical protein IK115_04565 [Lachnospiraceae bacterium]|nr:hypothetical protein [Lachnospiraceae bacterium]